VAGDVIVELSNPGIELEVLEAERQWTAAQAELLSLSRGLGMEQLDLESSVASLQVEHDEVRRLALVASQLALDSLVTVHDSKTASDREQAVATRLQAQRARLDLLSDTSPREIALLRDQVERLQAICRYHVERRNSLRIQAGADGVVQSLDLQIGQWVQSGTTVAIVARTDELTAELKIPQGQAADVRPGQRVMIEARPDSIRGRIRRVDPAVAEGHVLVEVELTDALPSAARPNLNVLGTIQLERLPDRLLVDRPAYGSRNGRCQAFRCTNDRRGAELVTVTFGRGSFNQIEVVDGLEQGDVLILSDMSKYDGAARLVIR
jgi:multidrug resistance efflux pump